jgi:hypothetical protein
VILLLQPPQYWIQCELPCLAFIGYVHMTQPTQMLSDSVPLSLFWHCGNS